MIYFDTCYMLKCYLDEPGHREVKALWLADGKVSCCEIGRAEFVAGIHRHVREGRLPPDDFTEIVLQWREDRDGFLWNWVPPKEELFEEVERLFSLLPPTVYLRASDALHLASAKMLGLGEIYSNDRHLLKAAEYFGIVPRNVVPPV